MPRFSGHGLARGLPRAAKTAQRKAGKPFGKRKIFFFNVG